MVRTQSAENSMTRNNSRRDFRTLFFLLLISLITYAPLIRQLGFYWDDWPMLWFEITQGPEGFLQAFTIDRPFLGYFYYLTAMLFGSDPLVWQIVTILFRWAVSCAFWWLLKQLWEDNSRVPVWGAVLLTTYSGFRQMPIAYVWGNALILLFLYIFSYGIMLRAVAHAELKRFGKYWLWTLIGVMCCTYTTLCTEYYTGLDLTRGLILWIFLLRYPAFIQSSFWKKIWKTVWYWLPYLLVLAGFMFWRVFIFKFPSYQPVLMTDLAANPLRALPGLLNRILQDFYTATWGAWTEYFRFPSADTFSSVSDKLFWLITAAGFVLILLFLIRDSRSSGKTSLNTNERQTWIPQALILGTVAVVFSGLPYIVTSLIPRLEFPYDRWLIVYMFGSVLILCGAVAWLVRSHTAQIILISLFAAMAMGGNLLNANTYRRDWNNQQSFVDQLITRIPAFEKPMYLLTDSNPLEYETDNSLTGMANLALAPDVTGESLPIGLGFFHTRFLTTPERLTGSEPFYQGFRSAMFGGSPSDVVVYFYSPPGCLRILDPKQHQTLPIFPDQYYQLMTYSHPEKIMAGEKQPSFIQETIFKTVPEENWCRFFQQADLARQNQDWAAIAAIGDEALPRFSAGEASEYIPFIEGYANLGRWQDAVPLIRRIHEMNKDLDGPLCPIVQELFISSLPQEDGITAQVQDAMFLIGCKVRYQ